MIRPHRLAIALAALTFASPVLAQDGAATGDPHRALAVALTSDEFIERSYEQAIVMGFEGALRGAPEMAAIEAECPGILGAMTAAAEPIMRPAYRRDFAAYRDRLTGLFRGELSPAQAREGADFFASPLGRRFLLSLAANLSAEAQLGAIVSSGGTAITSEALDADNLRSARDGLSALEPLDRREVERTLTSAGWAREFVRLQPMIARYQLDMANSAYLPEEDAAMDAALEAAAETHLTACYADNRGNVP
ncbi:hypothetical protein J4558_01450 [Leptolyngbya sp. 15MV]|nr:hypothetical protein J4558_01450 [Leptolyngbya sp. 15MV]